MATFGSLFSGIGGLDLGLERAGWQPAWQVEIDDYANRVLAKHWPGVRRWKDVCGFPPEPFPDWSCDLIAGGFPCQPVARSGRRRAESDERWLWPEMARVVRLLRPQYVLLENVPGLLDRGLERVLGDLAQMGFDAEWGVLSACQFGAPHTRERVFLVAYANQLDGSKRLRIFQDRPQADESGNLVACSPGWLEPFGGVRGISDGIPHRVDRVRLLGNAVVPQIAEWIGRSILSQF